MVSRDKDPAGAAKFNANRFPTPYPALNGVLDDFVGRVSALLAYNFVGAYLQGSFAIGGFDIYSDVDFLIVLDRDVTDQQLPLLQALHENIYALPSPWAQHLEGSYVPKQELLRFPPPQRDFWYLDHGAKLLTRSNHDDTLVVYWTLREKGITLVGPRPTELVAPIPVDRLRDEIFATMLTWRDHFAAWATEHLDARWGDLIRHACDARPGDAAVKVREPADAVDLGRTWQFVEYAICLGRRWKSTGSL
jgi:hypothetical protein